MKKLFAVAVFCLLSTGAYAANCSAHLEGPRGRILDSFYGYGFDQFQACEDARLQCKRELARRPVSGLRCRVDNVITPPRREACTSTMRRRDGASIDFFTAFGFDRLSACREARMQCEHALRLRQSRGMNPFAYCEVDGRGPGPGRDHVVRSCSVERVELMHRPGPGPRPFPGPRPGPRPLPGRGYVVQVHTATATGIRGSGVQQRACMQAERQCQLAAHRRQVCRRR